MRSLAWTLAILFILMLPASASEASGGNPTEPHRLDPERAGAGLGGLSDKLMRFADVVRRRDFDALLDYFHEQVQFGASLPPGQTTHSVNLIVHSRRLGSTVRGLRHTRQEVVASWETFLDRFETIEDARFVTTEVTSAGTDPTWVQDAEVQFALVGRGHDGSRLWMSGAGRLDADFVLGRGWRFSRFELDRVDEYRCLADPLDASNIPAYR